MVILYPPLGNILRIPDAAFLKWDKLNVTVVYFISTISQGVVGDILKTGNDDASEDHTISLNGLPLIGERDTAGRLTSSLLSHAFIACAIGVLNWSLCLKNALHPGKGVLECMI